jgi:Family of unknown function (DUF5709)
MARPDREGPGAAGSPEDEGIPDLDPTLPSKEATGDAQEGLVVPGDEPRGVDEHGTTADEQRSGEPLEDKLEREEHDREELDGRRAGRLIEDGEGLTDQEKDEVAEEAPDDRQGLSAEEAAVRVDEEARGGVDRDRDRYVEEP